MLAERRTFAGISQEQRIIVEIIVEIVEMDIRRNAEGSQNFCRKTGFL